MPNGTPKPLALVQGHRTKAEKDIRAKAEAMLKTGTCVTESKETKIDKIAHLEFLRLKRLFNKIEFVEALDTQVVNRYCIGISALVRIRSMVDKMESVLDDVKEIDGASLAKAYTAINGLIGKIQQQEKLLLSYEDRLFLNPAGRMRAIPKKPEKKEAAGIQAYKERRDVR